ncbi:ADP-ribosylglycohydrolase family protein [Estrella lausannensis]|uniref:Putative membrane protein n=1 Tax=Estrella lausannensis TaxID=483423 RepID=A0A0H5DNS3_9BACT|nr:ADP-ribosylglycohydrolase family protein [Estrella lausannensis]CRX37468.1 putative membrane protein [Estrella lausannensis]
MDPAERTSCNHSDSYHLFHGGCPDLDQSANKKYRKQTIALGVCTLGIAHAIYYTFCNAEEKPTLQDRTIAPLESDAEESANDDATPQQKLAQKVTNSMLLSAIGDTIGYGSGHNPSQNDFPWECSGSWHNQQNALNRYYEGSIRNIHFRTPKDEQRWIVSDDTIFQLIEAESILKVLRKDRSAGYLTIVDRIAKDASARLEEEFSKKTLIRSFGSMTYQCHMHYKQDIDHWRELIEYNPKAMGCGASMRGGVFGLFFPGENNRDMLIPLTLFAGTITTPSTMGILGGLASALFTAYALEDKPVGSWIPQMLEDFEKAKKFLEMVAKDKSFSKAERNFAAQCIEPENWNNPLGQWIEYYQLLSDSKPVLPKFDTFPKDLDEVQKFHSKFLYKTDNYQSQILGKHATNSVILAHHGLMSAVAFLLSTHEQNKKLTKNPGLMRPSDLQSLMDKTPKAKLEQVVDHLIKITGMHGGDTDSTCCIALGIYGALAGTRGIAPHHLQELEYRQLIEGIGDKADELLSGERL